MQFLSVCQKLMDNWISVELDASPERIYREMTNLLTLKMRLSVIELKGSDPKGWFLRGVKSSKISALLLNLDALFQDGKLGDFKDQSFLERAVFPAYTNVVARRQPSIDTVETKLLGVRVVYDRVILPQKSTAEPQWLITCTHGRFMAAASPSVKIDDVDESIILHLLTGRSAREIAAVINLSPRTVEHRLERLKTKFSAMSLAHLAATVVATGFDRSIDFSHDDRQN